MFYSGRAEEAAHLVSNAGPAMRVTKEFDGSSADFAEIKMKVAAGFQKYVVNDGVRIPATLNFFQAIKV